MPPRRRNVLVRKLRTVRKTLRRQDGFSKNMDSLIYPYRQYCNTASLTYPVVSSALKPTENCYAWQFQLNMIPQFATFVALYDCYRIDMVEFTVRPRAMHNVPLGTTQGTPTGQFLNNFIIAIDNDDATIPASYNALREYGNAKEVQNVSGKKTVFKFKPAVAMQIYNGVTAANTERFSPWIDCANPDVPHYGIKMALPGTEYLNLTVFDISVRYLLSFKQVR